MNAPPLVLVPPTPLNPPLHPPPPSSAGTTSSDDSRTTSSSNPEVMFTKVDQERTSSETTIFSIYSMYGDERGQRASWAATSPVLSGDRGHKAPAMPPSVSLAVSPNRHDALFRASGYESSELAYYDPNASRLPPVVDMTEGGQNFQTSSSAARSSLRVPHTGTRPVSSYAPPPTLEPPPSELLEDRTKSRTLSPNQSIRSRSASPHSLRSSQTPPPSHNRHSVISTRELPPLPPSTNTTPPCTPPPIPLRRPSPALLLTPRASLRLPGNLQSNVSSPASKISLAPSEGEDMDSFHVRQTYALLEVSGVKGDGYEEGVERTRARIGSNRQSQLNADAAVGDGREKSRDLDPREVELLSSVDRYGFFSTPSHDRLILLSAAPLTKQLSPVRAGPPTVSPVPISLKLLPSAPQPLRESGRIAKWTRMLQPLSRDLGGNVEMWRVRRSKESKLRERIYKGIPDRWRAAAWDLLLSRYAGMDHRDLSRLGAEYRDRLDQPSQYDIQIDLDVPRTISGHVMFKTRYGAGQRSLFHVLHSFSLRCSTCGYVQGMGPIAATLLCYFEPERVYASLVRLHDAYNLHDVFNPGFPGLLEAIYVQERAMERMMPDVYQAFKKHMISTTSYATKWYITLFANSVPFQTQLRLWDAFLLEGYDLFIAVALAIIWVYRNHITASSANFETVLSLLSSFFVPEDENLFLKWIGKALGDKKLRANMTKWRANWKQLVAEGKDGSALL